MSQTPIKLSQRARTLMHLKEFVPRIKQTGEVGPPTFNHLLDGQTYKTDWATPTRPGATDHLSIQSRGEYD